jgi:hypothetical protein
MPVLLIEFFFAGSPTANRQKREARRRVIFGTAEAVPFRRPLNSTNTSKRRVPLYLD